MNNQQNKEKFILIIVLIGVKTNYLVDQLLRRKKQ